MKLRHKLALLAFLYVVALAGNVALCAWCILEYYTILSEGSAALVGSTAGSAPSAKVFDQSVIVRILLLNTLLGCGVALMGIRMVRRWVMRPIAELEEAAVQIANGNLQHRVPHAGPDELGTLGQAVNRMAAEVLRMQAALVEQERREVASRALRCVVHNIRGPLTGIRWLAEALMSRANLSPAVKGLQARVVRSVDGILQRLQAFRHSLAGVPINKERTPAAAILSDLDAWAEGHRLTVESGGPADFNVDPQQFRAALEAVVAYAAKTARPDDGLEVAVRRSAAPPNHIEFIVGTAAGAERGVAEATAAPVPLAGTIAMAEGIIRLHGGRLAASQDAWGRITLTVAVPAD